jgi:hypothetical protein
MSHPLDIISLTPCLLRSLKQLMEYLAEFGLEIYPEGGAWCWRWDETREQSACGFNTIGAALVDALMYRLERGDQQVMQGLN